MEAPTQAEIRASSPLLAENYPSPAKDDALELLITVASPLVGALTGRAIGGYAGDANVTVEDVPPGMLGLARAAIARKAEQLDSAVGTAEDREDAIERSRVRSISAGSWSEAYWGPGEAAKEKKLDSDPVLAEVLWALCTAEKQAEWLQLWDPEHAPGFGVVEAFDYGMRPGGYEYPYGYPYSSGGGYGWLGGY